LSGARRSLDYQDFHGLATSCASELQTRGLQRSDRVAIYLPKSTEETAAIFAALIAGGAFVCINPLLVGHQAAHILIDSGATHLITSKRDWSRIRDDAMKVSSLRYLLLIDDESEQASDVLDGVPAAFAVMKPKGGVLREALSIGEDLAALLYTSGSTGKPRGVMLSHRNLLAGSRIVSSYLGIGPSERILSILPFGFDYGLNQLLTSIENHATIALFQYRFPSELVKTLKAESITGLAGVPLVWAGLTHHSSGLVNTPLPTVRYITNSGGSVPTPTVKALRQLLPGTQIFLMYGLTEAFRATYLPPSEVDLRPNSIGKAIPETEILVIGSDGQPCKAGEPGILVQRGPTVSLGYWNNPERTQEVLRPNPLVPPERGGETVCYSGDVVKMDEEGFFYFVARVDGQIKSQGYRISPTEVEEVLMQAGGLAEVAVIGIPAADAGEQVHAVVVPASAESFDAPAALRQCAQRLPTYMAPKSIDVVPSLPRTPNGKIDYQLLRAQKLVQPS
jgi:acyl-CoA ligase (AMP-forming) (exosortase A-associated)